MVIEPEVTFELFVKESYEQDNDKRGEANSKGGQCRTPYTPAYGVTNIGGTVYPDRPRSHL